MKAFTADTGVHGEYNRISTSKFVATTITEFEAGKLQADVVQAPLPVLELLKEKPYPKISIIEITDRAGVNKAAGVKRFAEILHFNHGGNRIVYAGDDENDATAMEWVIRQGGIAFSVGKKAILPAARHVPDPEALAAEIRRLFRIDVNREQAATKPGS